MESDLEWSSAYETGLPEIDAQHLALVQIVQRMSEQSNEREMVACILHLFRYAREHFATEELLMRQLAFPGIDAHIAQHRELVAIMTEATDAKWATSEEIRRFKGFVADWLVDHIVHSDLEIKRFMDRGPSSD